MLSFNGELISMHLATAGYAVELYRTTTRSVDRLTAVRLLPVQGNIKSRRPNLSYSSRFRQSVFVKLECYSAVISFANSYHVLQGQFYMHYLIASC